MNNLTTEKSEWHTESTALYGHSSLEARLRSLLTNLGERSRSHTHKRREKEVALRLSGLMSWLLRECRLKDFVFCARSCQENFHQKKRKLLRSTCKIYHGLGHYLPRWKLLRNCVKIKLFSFWQIWQNSEGTAR